MSLAFVIATLCQLQNRNVNLHLKLIACILYSGQCSKQVTISFDVTMKCYTHNFRYYDRLQNINLCVSHSTMVRMLQGMGKDHDLKVLQWKEELEQRVLHQSELKHSHVSYIYN